MKRITSLLVCLLLFGFYAIFGQEIQVRGKITSADDGSPIPGAYIKIKGTSSGTASSADGNYQLNVPADATLIFSSVGYADQEIPVAGQSVINVALNVVITEVDEVVVTALGITKEKKALGYAVSEVSSDQLDQKPETDVVRLLSGKASGVRVTQTSGVSGTGTNITIRGYSSVTGSNQPLFIVDGVRFGSATNTGTGNTQGFLDGNQATSSRFLDIDPSTIQSVSILKGLSATTIYGNEGRNGVIIITTSGAAYKSNKKFEVTVNGSYFANKVNLPDFQENWGCGFQQSPGFFYSNWGLKFTDPPLLISHPYGNFSDPNLLAAFPEYQGATYEYKYYDSVREFFRTGSVSTLSVNLSGATEKASYNANVSYTDDIGFLPGNELTKFNAGIGGSAQLSNKISYSGTMNFYKTDMATPPISYGNGSGIGGGTGISVFADVLYTPASVDLMGLPFESPITHESVYYRGGNDIQNPRWTTKYTKQLDNVTRVFTSGNLNYDILSGLKLSYKYGIDYYDETQEYIVNKGGVQNDNYINGLYRTRRIDNLIWDQSVVLTYNKNLTDKFNLDVLLGGSSVRELANETGMESTKQSVFGFINHSNFQEHSAVNSFSSYDLQSKAESNTLGLFGQATLGYDSYLYLNVSARNDWFSSLQKANRSQFYPSFSLSFIPTQAFEQIQSPNGLNYLKLRIGYGTSAGFPPLYVTENILNSNVRTFVSYTESGTPVKIPSNSNSSQLGNKNLKPELHRELEGGIEARFLDNRVSLDLTLYTKKTKDLITNSDLDPASGWQYTFVNIGEIQNKGIEAQLGVTPVRTSDVIWTLTGIFTKNSSIVKKLAAGQDQILISGWSNLGNFAKPGEQFGVMMGSKILRNDDGEAIISGTGDYQETNDIYVIGNPNPDYELSLNSEIKYKGFTFSMLWEYRKGGDIYSETCRTLLGRGITKDTDFDRYQSFVLPGVKEDGSPNDIQITSSNFYFNDVGLQAPAETGVWDGTTIRLRDITLTYSIPAKLLEKTPFGSASISFSGQNLWYKAVNFPKYCNFDPDMLSLGVGNGMGFDFITGPSSSRYGLSVQITF
jgi:TonB-linked SusC/RagA family outer membrane protein